MKHEDIIEQYRKKHCGYLKYVCNPPSKRNCTSCRICFEILMLIRPKLKTEGQKWVKEFHRLKASHKEKS